jgi:hypothetical protein
MTHDDTQKTVQEQLPPAQLQVLQGLLSGESVSGAAKAGQVSRETVHRWLREDFKFQAAYNRGRREILEEIQDALLVTARDAMEKVAEAVRSGDVRVALTVLKGVGGLEGRSPRIGSGDPDRLQKEADIERNEEEAMMTLRALSSSF